MGVIWYNNIIRPPVAIDYRKAHMATAINGSLSPTALDQMQLFSTGSIAVKNNTAYWLYTANGQGTPTWDIDKIFLATKNLNDGLPINQGWVKYNGGSGDAIAVINEGGTGWKQRQVFSRTLIYDEDEGIFKLWYSGQQADYNISTGYATSSDCVTWSEYASNPIHQDDGTFGYPGEVTFSVLKEAVGSYHAISCGDGNVKTKGAIYLTSTDGISWTKVRGDLFIGLDVRFVNTIKKIGSLYYVWVNYGVNSNYYTNGLPTTIRCYSTADFITFSDLGDIYTYIEPEESGVIGTNIFNHNNKYYIGYTYYKNQVKYNGNNGEPFTALKIIESNRDFTSPISDPTVYYPPYLRRYYPCYELPESQTPKERIKGDLPTVTGTLSWTKMRYVDFNGSQKLTYPAFTPSNASYFATKARVNRLLTGTHHIVRQDNPSGSRGWNMYLSTGYLIVELYDNNVLAKKYQTDNQIVKPTGVYDENDHVSVGFIFDSGTLKLCFGSSCDQPVTKVTDNSITQIQTGGNSVEIGADSANQTRSICLFGRITEYQWLYEIDL